MNDLTTEKYLKKVDNVYSLVILAAKRTVSLNRGEKGLLPDTEEEKPIMIALKEIAAGKIKLEAPKADDVQEAE